MAARLRFLGLVAGLTALAWPAAGQYNRTPESDIDPGIFRIDETRFLGVRVDRELRLRDEKGEAFRLGEMLGQPLIIVLAYYQCDGTCSVVNNDLLNLVGEAKRVAIGRDFRVLTVSFDKHDTVQTLAAFGNALKLPDSWGADWRLSLPAEGEDIRRLTDAIGFKFFWSPRDRIFFHPGVFVFLSAEGRVVRFLYSLNSTPRDVELAIFDARQGNVGLSQVANFALSLCYSYNFAEGKYTFNIPLFIGAGSFFFGITSLVVAVIYYRRRREREGTV